MIDLVGQRFDRLVVISKDGDYVSPKGATHSKWICLCDCGSEISVVGYRLRNGSTKSCGCLKKDILAQKAKDLTGEHFGRLTAIESISSIPERGVAWRCLCDCGNETIVYAKELRSGNTKSCGCLRNNNIAQVNKTHGKSHTRLYNVWAGMRQRCNDPEHKSYKNYGGRGISVCEEWNDYEIFEKWAYENGYNPAADYSDCTLDRIDVNGNYSPQNCRWTDAKTQASNKR